jgi:acetyl-CoA carboxylase biotin carboxyl carrier protein
MKLDTLEKLIELVRKSGVHQVEIEDGGVRMSVTASAPHAGYMQPAFAPQGLLQTQQSYAAQVPPPPPVAAAVAVTSKPIPVGKVLRSPFVGTFYRSPSPGSDYFVEIGRRVRKGDTLCIVEAMKLMNEIEAECDGVIKEILVDNESPVEFDQPLFVLE